MAITKQLQPSGYSFLKDIDGKGLKYENATPASFTGLLADKVKLDNSEECVRKYGRIANSSTLFCMDTSQVFMWCEVEGEESLGHWVEL